jgi:hypothetical protein
MLLRVPSCQLVSNGKFTVLSTALFDKRTDVQSSKYSKHESPFNNVKFNFCSFSFSDKHMKPINIICLMFNV